MPAAVKTIVEVLDSGEAYLSKRGVESPRLQIEHLLADVLGIARMQLYMQFDRPLDEPDLAPLREKLRRRGEREPLQYILGKVEFCSRDFLCDSRALIPRPETELLVEISLGLLKKTEPNHIIDIGTGSGVIGLSLAAELYASACTATLADSDTASLILAIENLAQLATDNTLPELANRVTLQQSTLLTEVEVPANTTLLVANLPYVTTDELDEFPDELGHEPDAAFHGGADGLDLIRLLLDQAAEKLPPGCHIALEHGHQQSAAVQQLLTERGFAHPQSHPDLDSIQRFATAQKV